MSGDGMVNLAPHGWPIALTTLSEHRALEARSRQCLRWIASNSEAARNRGRTIRRIFLRWYQQLLMDLPVRPASEPLRLVVSQPPPEPTADVVELRPLPS